MCVGGCGGAGTRTRAILIRNVTASLLCLLGEIRKLRAQQPSEWPFPRFVPQGAGKQCGPGLLSKGGTDHFLQAVFTGWKPACVAGLHLGHLVQTQG